MQTAAHMKAAIESHGRVKGCYASVCKVQTMSQTMHKHTMTGIQAMASVQHWPWKVLPLSYDCKVW